MYTHIYTVRADAEKLFRELARKPLGPGETGLVTHATFNEHFTAFAVTYLDKLGAQLEINRDGLFTLKFRRYLAHLPREFYDLEIQVTRAEIVRFNSAPTRARAGYYENPKTGFTATVERVFPTQDARYKNPAPVYVQNITVSGPSLGKVQEFNTKLSEGSYGRFLVNAFE